MDTVTVGDVVRYHSVIGRPDFELVRIERGPYLLGDGSLICKARRLSDGRAVYPSLRALAPAPAPTTTSTCGIRFHRCADGAPFACVLPPGHPGAHHWEAPNARGCQ